MRLSPKRLCTVSGIYQGSPRAIFSSTLRLYNYALNITARPPFRNPTSDALIHPKTAVCIRRRVPRTSHILWIWLNLFHNYLWMSNNANDLAVTEHLAEVVFNALLAQVNFPFFAGFGESLLLWFVPESRQIAFIKYIYLCSYNG